MLSYLGNNDMLTAAAVGLDPKFLMDLFKCGRAGAEEVTCMLSEVHAMQA